jgi:hypothetical protein
VAEGAPLLREYVGKTCIEGSNPSVSASTPNAPKGASSFLERGCGDKTALPTGRLKNQQLGTRGAHPCRPRLARGSLVATFWLQRHNQLI